MELTRRELAGLPCLHEGHRSVLYLRDGAVLKLPRAGAGGPSEPERLAREYQLTLEAAGAGVRRARELVSVEGIPGLVLDYVEGETLRAAFVERRRTLAEVLEVAGSLARALDEVHRRGLVHRHLTSLDVLVARGGTAATLIDFGDATHEDGPAASRHAAAPADEFARYAAPELSGRMGRPADHRADLYACGVILYEVLTGRLPFAAASVAELLHLHLAKAPAPPRELEPATPPVLSELVLRLLAKDPDDRYQTARGLAVDLERCAAELARGGTIPPFPLGREDVPASLRVPRALHGREEETGALLAAVERVRGGAGAVVLVAGTAGAGKSALVLGVRRAVVEAGGWFVEGRFDQYRQRAPYAAFVQAASALVEDLLAESAGALADLGGRLARDLGPDAALLAEVVPRLALVTGAPAPAEAAAPAGERGFERAFSTFLRAVARDRPLTLFVDDVQWCDVASARLLEALAGGEPLPHLLLAVAFRDDEVDAGHPASAALRAAAGAGAITLTLRDLGADALERLVADALGCEPERARPLALVVREKTGGNPLCTVQLLQALHGEGAVAYDPAARAWAWDLARVRARDVSLNVAALLADELARLPPATMELLALAACLGQTFDLADLAALSDRTPEEAARDLAPALDKGMLSRPDGLAFSHPRVRQAARSTLARAQRRAVHLAIGRLLLKEPDGPRREERVFAVADHLNEAFQLLEAEAERLQLAELDLAAGRKARRAAAREAAIWYLNMGIGLLPSDRWERHPELTLSLYVEAVEAEYRCGDFQRAEMLSSEVLQHAADPSSRARMRDVRALFFAAQDQGAVAVREAREALRLVGVELPAGAEALEAHAAELSAELARRIPRVEDLAELAPMRAPERLAELRALSTLATAARGRDPALHEVAVCRMVLASAEHGTSPLSALAYAWWGALLCGRGRDVATGYRFGRLALEVAALAGAPELEPRVRALFHGLVQPWREHVRRTLEPLREAAGAAADAGDPEAALAARVEHVVLLVCAGEPLEVVRQLVNGHRDPAPRGRQEGHAGVLRIWAQAVQALAGGDADPGRLGGDLLDASALLPDRLEEDQAASLCARFACRAMLQVLLDDPAGALESARLAERHAGRSEAGFLQVLVAFHHALALAIELPRATGAAREAAAQELAEVRGRLERWSRDAPMNVAHLRDLVEAERARVEGDTLEAMTRFRAAIRGAREQGFRHHEALAYERAAAFYLGLGMEDFAGLCVRRAASRYRLWGAARKVAALEERHRQLLAREDAPSLDAAAIVEGSAALSRELHLEQLVTELLRIVIERAGAERGVLLERRGDGLVVRARAAVGEGVQVLSGTPVEDDPDVALPIVNYVARTLTPVVLDDAARESGYAAGGALARRRTRSLLCLPVTHQGKLTGLLYLENDLAPGVFTPDRLELVRALSSQAAISMENARLYSNLETTVRELRAAEDALRKSEEFLSNIVENLPDMVFVKDAASLRFVRMNRAGEELLGLARSELLGKGDFDFFPPEEARFFTEADREVLRSGRLRDIPEEPIETRQGRRWLHTKKIPIADRDGRPLYLLGISEDVTERKRAAEAARAANERFRSVLRAATAYAIIGTDLRGLIQVFNEGAEQMLGWRAEEVVDRHTPELFHDPAEIAARAAELGVAPGFEVFVAATRDGRVETREWTYLRKDGSRVAVSLTVAPLRGEGGALTGFFGIARDVSGEKRLEQQLRQSQKLESIGLLAGGIAHDFNNLLMPILGQTEMLLEELRPDDGAREPLQDILEAAQRAKTLTRQLLAFGRRQRIELRTVDLKQVVEGCAAMLRRMLREDVQIELGIPPGLRPVRADPSQLEQVLLNLAINAQDAMPGGGRLLVEAADFEVDASYAERNPGVSPGAYVRLTVSDTGVGMNPAALEHAFEPFFTTKAVGKGTGLGLSVVYGIVKQHGGAVSVYSEKDRGTTFKILLPATTGPLAAAAPQAEPVEPARGTETVLVAEDDPKVRRVTCAMLENLGYVVHAPDSAEACAALAREHPGAIDVLLTDVVMPRMNGKALYEELRRARPRLKVLFMSGYTRAALDGSGLGGAAHFLQKPFTALALSHALRRVLDEPA